MGFVLACAAWHAQGFLCYSAGKVRTVSTGARRGPCDAHTTKNDVSPLSRSPGVTNKDLREERGTLQETSSLWSGKDVCSVHREGFWRKRSRVDNILQVSQQQAVDNFP
jgi:hypothetical protein